MPENSAKNTAKTYKHWKVFELVLATIYASAIVAAMAILHNSEWHTHIMRLLRRSWAVFVAQDVGSTSRGILSGAMEAVLTIVAVAVIVGYLHGFKEFKKHNRETAIIALLALPTVAALVYGPQFAWEVSKAIYIDHEDLSTTRVNLNRREALLVDPKSRDEEIRRLRGVLAKYQNATAPAMGVYPISHDQKSGMPRMEYVLTTNSTRDSVSIEERCDIPISDTSIMPMTKSGTSASSVRINRISPNQIRFDIGFPVWSPASPEWVTIFFAPPVNAMPQCVFGVD